jgi:hypothetical protein
MAAPAVISDAISLDVSSSYKGTHLVAALTALKALGGSAAGSAIADYVEEKKLLKKEMDVREAVSWVLSYGVRVGLLKAKESK